jgi:hypothetical protein
VSYIFRFKDSVNLEDEFTVISEAGWVEAAQSNQYGVDRIDTMAPSDARKLAIALLNAADDAETHVCWNVDDAGRAKLDEFANRITNAATNLALSWESSDEEVVKEIKLAQEHLMNIASEMRGKI